MKYFIRTFGCQQNIADSERIAAYYESRGYEVAESIDDADIVAINTCMVRKKAEDRVYGLATNLGKMKKKKPELKIVVTGCMVGTALREPTGKYNKRMRRILHMVDHFLPIEEVGFEYHPIREEGKHAWVPITHGCNNFCTFCVVPYSRGKEVSRPFEDIIEEVQELVKEGYTEITLLGQNVNSYGSDLVKAQRAMQEYTLKDGTKVPTTMVKHLGKMRIPTLFPNLLEQVAQVEGVTKVSFTSSNPWDFSDELIDVITRNKNINREIHLPVQSGDDNMLRRMNRWYTHDEYVELIEKMRSKISGVTFTTDIIVGFPGETEEEFQNTYKLCEKIGFVKSYTAKYSNRPGTRATLNLTDDVPWEIKTKRWELIDELVNKN